MRHPRFLFAGILTLSGAERYELSHTRVVEGVLRSCLGLVKGFALFWGASPGAKADTVRRLLSPFALLCHHQPPRCRQQEDRD